MWQLFTVLKDNKTYERETVPKYNFRILTD